MNKEVKVGAAIQYFQGPEYEPVPARVLKVTANGRIDLLAWSELYGSERPVKDVPEGVQDKGEFWLRID